MKKRIFLQSFICLLAVSCTVRELDVVTPTPTKDGDEDLVFYASLESSEPDTRVVLDENIKILWDPDDRISIFNESTLNQQFRFKGEEQANSGEFGSIMVTSVPEMTWIISAPCIRIRNRRQSATTIS